MRNAIAIVGAASAAVAVWGIAQLGGAALSVHPTGRPAMEVGLPLVLLTAVVAGVAGWVSLALLRRLTGRGSRIWTWVATATLVLSLAMPFTVAASATTRWWLVAMHVAVGAVLIPVMGKEVRRGDVH